MAAIKITVERVDGGVHQDGSFLTPEVTDKLPITVVISETAGIGVNVANLKRFICLMRQGKVALPVDLVADEDSIAASLGKAYTQHIT